MEIGELRSWEVRGLRLLWRFSRRIDGGGELLENLSKFRFSSWDPAGWRDLVRRKLKMESLGVVESCFFWRGLDWLVIYIFRVDLFAYNSLLMVLDCSGILKCILVSGYWEHGLDLIEMGKISPGSHSESSRQ